MATSAAATTAGENNNPEQKATTEVDESAVHPVTLLKMREATSTTSVVKSVSVTSAMRNAGYIGFYHLIADEDYEVRFYPSSVDGEDLVVDAATSSSSRSGPPPAKNHYTSLHLRTQAHCEDRPLKNGYLPGKVVSQWLSLFGSQITYGTYVGSEHASFSQFKRRRVEEQAVTRVEQQVSAQMNPSSRGATGSCGGNSSSSFSPTSWGRYLQEAYFAHNNNTSSSSSRISQLEDKATPAAEEIEKENDTINIVENNDPSDSDVPYFSSGSEYYTALSSSGEERENEPKRHATDREGKRSDDPTGQEATGITVENHLKNGGTTAAVARSVSPPVVASGESGVQGSSSSTCSPTSTSTSNATVLRQATKPGGHLVDWIYEVKGDFLWLVFLDSDPDLVLELYALACFTLPTFLPPPTCFVINPEQRFCIDLLQRPNIKADLSSAAANESALALWGKCKMVRRYAKDLRITVNKQFSASLKALQKYHAGKVVETDQKVSTSGKTENESEGSGGGSSSGTTSTTASSTTNAGSTPPTWLNDELMDLLTKFHHDEQERKRTPNTTGPPAPDDLVEQCVFEFWENDELVALCAGFAVGKAYHDYSMATLKRDKRSLGAIASKVVGHLLQKTGFEIWYWGCKIGYMNDYAKYGGRDFGRAEFKKRWLEASSKSFSTYSSSSSAAPGVEESSCSSHLSSRVQEESCSSLDAVMRVLKAGQGLVALKEEDSGMK
ncbi:unnamed protein product [Amoebophrya sp. A120]|nr:unnamed protein product [Amoebophrya sp. A120]|eukprot:GSA120T00023224001.1